MNAALAAERPLLVRGEPGVGKTQLAEAAARELRRAFVGIVVDARTESRDLLWRFDAVMRLAEAQLLGAQGVEITLAREQLAVAKFVSPGPLWWAMNWSSARDAWEGGGRQEVTPLDDPDNDRWKDNGWVVLIDEIDKGESDLPNGLLKALGASRFTPPGGYRPVSTQGVAPLVLITTNEERVLPDAFVRRTIVLDLRLPDDDTELQELLVARGRAHFGKQITEEVLAEAAQLLIRNRRVASEAQLMPRPGQAEYLDLVRAALALRPKKPAAQKALLESLARFTLQKHSDMRKSQPPESP